MVVVVVVVDDEPKMTNMDPDIIEKSVCIVCKVGVGPLTRLGSVL